MFHNIMVNGLNQTKYFMSTSCVTNPRKYLSSHIACVLLIITRACEQGNVIGLVSIYIYKCV